MNNKDDIVGRLNRISSEGADYHFENGAGHGLTVDGPVEAYLMPVGWFGEVVSRIQLDAKRIAELEAEVERLRPRAALCEKAWQDIAITGEVDSTTEKAIVAHFEEPTP